MKSSRAIYTFSLLALFLAARCPAEDTDAELAEKVKLLSDGDKRTIEAFRKTLPEGYTVRPTISQRWSDDAHGIVTRLASLIPLDPGGKIDGEVRSLYRGSVMRSVPYVKGVKQGVEKKYSSGYVKGRYQRVLVAEVPWHEGKNHGVKKLYHGNGQVRVEVPYTKGVPDGVSKEFDLNGRTVKVTNYKKGKRHGEMTEYWTLTGKPRRIVPYKNDKVDGVVRDFYDSGQLKREIPAKKDLFHGVEKQYDEEGDLIKRRYWIKDEEATKEEFMKKYKHLAK